MAGRITICGWLMGFALVLLLSCFAALWVSKEHSAKRTPSQPSSASLADLPVAGGENLFDFYQPKLCGPASLYAICRLRGIETTIADLTELAGTDRRGTSIYGIIQAAQAKGMKAQAYESNLKHLREIQRLAIIDFPAGHFCVLHSWHDGKAFLIDPPRPNRLVPAEALEANWGKHVIIFE